MTYHELEGQKARTSVITNNTLIKTGELPPIIAEYSNYDDYVKARKAYNGDLSYTDNSEWENLGVYTQSEMEKAKRFDATIAQLLEKYPLPEDRKLVIGDYENVQYLLMKVQRERASDSAAAQIWVNSERNNQIVIGYRPKWSTTTFEEDIEIRNKTIYDGKILSSVYFNSAEGTAIHEYGHALEDYITNGMIFGDTKIKKYKKYAAFDKQHSDAEKRQRG